jgi:hypothetical protein
LVALSFIIKQGPWALDALTTKSPDSCGPFPGTPAEKQVMESELFGVIQIEN